MEGQLSKPEVINLLEKVRWDIPYTAEALYKLLMGEVDQIDGFTRQRLYTKIVNSFNWHVVRKIIPSAQLSDALSDEVIQGLFPRSLRDKYRNVRGLL